MTPWGLGSGSRWAPSNLPQGKAAPGWFKSSLARTRGVVPPGCVPREELPAASKCPLWLLEARGLGDGVDGEKVGAPACGFELPGWKGRSGFASRAPPWSCLKRERFLVEEHLGLFWGVWRQAIVEV